MKTSDLSLMAPALFAAVPTTLVVLLGAFLLNLILSRALTLFARRSRFTEEEILPVRRIIKWLIIAGALVLVLSAFGMNIGGIWGIISTILAMVAIGFVAVWSVLSNSLCTIMILIFQPFAVGDEIEFVGEPTKGRVIDLNFIYTTVQDAEGALMQIPNNLFFQKVLRRRPRGHQVSLAEQLRSRTSHNLTEHSGTNAKP